MHNVTNAEAMLWRESAKSTHPVFKAALGILNALEVFIF
jgi:hypothetical protein